MSSLYRRNGIYWLSFRENGKGKGISLKTRDRTKAICLKAKKDLEIGHLGNPSPDQDREIYPIMEEYRKAYDFRKTKDSHNDDIGRVDRFFKWANIRKFSDITEKKLQDYLTYRISLPFDKEKKTKPITLNTANHIISNIKTFNNFARQRRYINDNPLRYFKRYKLERNLAGRFLSNEEITLLLNTAADPKNYVDGIPTFYPILATAIYSGMREDEVFNLEWQDINFSKNVISVLNKPSHTLKTKLSHIVPLSKKLKKILLPYRKESGRCFDTTNARRIFDRIIRKSNLKGIGWREIRRTMGSHLAMSGVSLLKIAKWYGHTNPSTTYKHYAHLAPETSDEDINRF